TLETISPLSSEIPPDAPKAAVVFVLDRSGSMIQAEGTGTRLQIARQATMEAVSLLEEGSLAGVVAFDSAADVVAPIREATDTAAFREQLQRLIALGGTAIYPGLELAFEEMKQVDPLYARHIVVMTDGLSRPGDFEGLLADIVAQGITVSAVAIGSAADTRLVSMIAELGGGAYHATEDFTALPQILTEETSRFTSEPVKEVTVDPTWRERSADYLAALPDDLPPLAGYVLTTAKPGAELHLVGPQDLPILASWRYGVGRVVAFASHAAGSWAAEWMADPAFPAWWAQIVRSALPGTAGPGLHANLRVDGTNALLTVEAIARDGSPREGLALTTVVAGPDGRRMTPLRLTETAPGTYTARFSVDSNGEYRAAVLAEETVTAIGGDAAIAPVEARAYVSLADGSGARPIAPEVFTAIARQTGGRVLEPGDALLPAAPGLRWSWKPAWPAWALLALGVFLVELLLRYRPAFGIPSIRRAARGSMA
ncbi:MAG TPA: VWA domain-containing protein, partial [Longimicrobiales bacterium]|nr:VWA domain-containing protein [Longimicrobiales bacterium]